MARVDAGAGPVDPRWINGVKSASSSDPDMVTDPAKKRGVGPDMVTDPVKQRGAGPDMVTDPAKKRGAAPDMVTDPAKKRGAGPDMVTDPAKKRGAAPDMVTDPAKERGAGPDMVTDPAKKRAALHMVTDPAKKRSAAPHMVTDPAKERAALHMVTDPAKKRAAAPGMVTDPAKKRSAAPDMVEDPARRRSPDADIFRATSGRASTKARMAPTKTPAEDEAPTVPAISKLRGDPPEVVVKNFVNDLISEIDLLGIELSVKQRESMKVEFATRTRGLIVAFEARELPFDKIVVKQHNGQIYETKEADLTNGTQPQATRFLGTLNALLGRKADKDTAEEEVSQHIRQWVSPVQDYRTRSFAWNESHLSTGGAPDESERIALAAELTDSDGQCNWLIELIDGGQANVNRQDAGGELSSAGIRRLLAPLLVGLGSAMQGDVSSSL